MTDSDQRARRPWGGDAARTVNHGPCPECGQPVITGPIHGYKLRDAEGRLLHDACREAREDRESQARVAQMVQDRPTLTLRPRAELLALGVLRDAYQCQDCQAISDEPTDSPLYECPECGTAFDRETSYNDNHQCPNDRRFSSRVGDNACAECHAGEAEPVEVLACAVEDCDDEALFADEDGLLDHLRGAHGLDEAA